MLQTGEVIICAFHYAKGVSLPFPELRWMTDKQVVLATGRWMGRFHTLSKQFSRDHTKLFLRSRSWSALHDSLMSEYQVHPEDISQQQDSDKWGTLHGDINPSNWFFDEERATLCMFDWDQVQQGWFMLDVAQACNAVQLLERAGMPCSSNPAGSQFTVLC